MSNTHYMTWNMSITLKTVENENCTLWDMEYGEKTENQRENEKQTLYDLDYGKKTENHGK